jgi:site-specific recombinase XerD
MIVEKLGLATPHGMSHARASHALARRAEQTTVRCGTYHPSIATTSVYGYVDRTKRVR